MLKKFNIKTYGNSLIDITGHVRGFVLESKVKSGLVVVYCPHTTAGITVNENADPDVKSDMSKGFAYTFADRREYDHFEGNSPAHIKSSVMGASQTFIIDDFDILLGRWQGIYFCEFDGPKSRNFYVKIFKEQPEGLL